MPDSLKKLAHKLIRLNLLYSSQVVITTHLEMMNKQAVLLYLSLKPTR